MQLVTTKVNGSPSSGSFKRRHSGIPCATAGSTQQKSIHRKQYRQLDRAPAYHSAMNARMRCRGESVPDDLLQRVAQHAIAVKQ